MDEQVVIVDDANRITGSAPRSRMRAERLRHRATYIFVFNDDSELCVQRRTLIKDLYPGYLDLACGGVVTAGESYEVSATREAAEELGIRNTALQPGFEFYFEDERVRVFGKTFTCVHNGPFELQAEEVESVHFDSCAKLLADTEQHYTPDSLFAFKRLTHLRSTGVERG